MCEYQHLCRRENGYIIRCPKCRHYEVHFARTILTLTDVEFFQLYHQLDSVKPKAYSEQVHVLTTPKQGVHMILSGIEVVEFYDMVERADSEARALELVELFNITPR